jgi:sulfite exporter TauE/SafE
MTWSLLLAALFMGLAGSLHCTAMCGAACMAIVRGGGANPARALLGFHAGRLASYAAGGAVAAASVGALAVWSQAAPALRPLWAIVHAAALMLGLWLAWTGRQPAWMMAIGRAPLAAAAPAGWQAMHGPLRSAAVGSGWVLLPCGLLQSALLVAALAGDALAGSLVMAVFASASSLGLVVAGATWQRLVATPAALRWAVRVGGLMLAAASAWALGHGLWLKIAVYCFG